MKKISTRATVESGIMATVIFMLMAIGTFIPGTAAFITFILPIPAILIYLRNNAKAAVFSLFISGILISMFNNPVLALGTLILTGLVSFALGYSIKHKLSFTNTLSLVFIGNLTGNIIDSILYYYLFLGSSIANELKKTTEELKLSMDQFNIMSQNFSVENYNNIDYNILLYLLPASFIILMLISSFVTYVITKKIISRFNFEMNPLPKFSNWYIDIKVTILIMAVAIFSFYMDLKNIASAKYFELSAMMLLYFFMGVVGAAVIDYVLGEKFKVKGKTRVLIIALLFLTNLGKYLFFIGLIDSIIDIRGLGHNSFKKAITGSNKN